MSRISVKEIILVPAVISLVITLIRLAGELMGGSILLFNPTAGGGGALIGISWLIPIFGVYFAWKLINMNAMTASPWKTLGIGVGAFVVMVAFAAGSAAIFGVSGIGSAVGGCVGAIVALWLCRMGWKELYEVLVAYAFAARIPVAIIMLIAILGDWQTHYDAPPPGFPEMNLFLKWILIGLLPQLTVWIAFTVIVGFIVAVPVMLLRGRETSAGAAV